MSINFTFAGESIGNGKMSRIFILVALWVFAQTLAAQNPPLVPPFRYVCVETIDYSGVKDIFQVSLFTRKWAIQNGYEVITDYRNNWPEEARKDSCSVMTIKLHTHDRYRGKYRTSLFVVDCKSDTVFQTTGKSIGPTAAEGFQNAASVALKDLKKQLITNRQVAKKEKKDKS